MVYHRCSGIRVPGFGGGCDTACGVGAVTASLGCYVVDVGSLDCGDGTSEGDRTTPWPDASENLAAA